MALVYSTKDYVFKDEIELVDKDGNKIGTQPFKLLKEDYDRFMELKEILEKKPDDKEAVYEVYNMVYDDKPKNLYEATEKVGLVYLGFQIHQNKKAFEITYNAIITQQQKK